MLLDRNHCCLFHFLSVAWESLLKRPKKNPARSFSLLSTVGPHKMRHRIHVVWGPVVLRPWSNVSLRRRLDAAEWDRIRFYWKGERLEASGDSEKPGVRHLRVRLEEGGKNHGKRHWEKSGKLLGVARRKVGEQCVSD